MRYINKDTRWFNSLHNRTYLHDNVAPCTLSSYDDMVVSYVAVVVLCHVYVMFP